PDGSRPLDRQVLRCLQDVVDAHPNGHLLVFLPGIADINATANRCEGFCRAQGLEIHRLHGDLSPETQERALAPSSTRKVILSTNIAETSVTIDGVTVVIDSGLAKIARTDSGTGTLDVRTQEISQASATQRMGRAGRTQPGTCIRLYSEDAFHRRPARELPEILRSDLTRLSLDLAAARLSPSTLSWLDDPPVEALQHAAVLLHQLGAVDADGVTDTGIAMHKIPAHPRFGKVLVEARARGVERLAAHTIATLQEGVRLRPKARGGRVDALEVFEMCRALDDRRTLGRLREVARQLCSHRNDDTKRGDAAELALAESMFLAFRDRIGAVVEHDAHARRVQFAEGGHAALPRESVAWEAAFCVAVSIDRRHHGARQTPTVQSAVTVEPDWVFEYMLDHLREE
ncbi:MAG: helicase-related protein, partial [Nannocystaceae bacterium]